MEGLADKIVSTIWASKMEIKMNLESPMPTDGKSSGKYHFTVWTEATENTGISTISF